MSINNYKRNDPSFGKPSSSKHHSNIFRHESSMVAKSNELKFDEEVDIYRASNYLSTRPLLITKGKNVTL